MATFCHSSISSPILFVSRPFRRVSSDGSTSTDCNMRVNASRCSVAGFGLTGRATVTFTLSHPRSPPDPAIFLAISSNVKIARARRIAGSVQPIHSEPSSIVM